MKNEFLDAIRKWRNGGNPEAIIFAKIEYCIDRYFYRLKEKYSILNLRGFKNLEVYKEYFFNEFFENKFLKGSIDYVLKNADSDKDALNILYNHINQYNNLLGMEANVETNKLVTEVKNLFSRFKNEFNGIENPINKSVLSFVDKESPKRIIASMEGTKLRDKENKAKIIEAMAEILAGNERVKYNDLISGLKEALSINDLVSIELDVNNKEVSQHYENYMEKRDNSFSNINADGVKNALNTFFNNLTEAEVLVLVAEIRSTISKDSESHVEKISFLQQIDDIVERTGFKKSALYEIKKKVMKDLKLFFDRYEASEKGYVMHLLVKAIIDEEEN